MWNSQPTDLMTGIQIQVSKPSHILAIFACLLCFCNFFYPFYYQTSSLFLSYFLFYFSPCSSISCLRSLLHFLCKCMQCVFIMTRSCHPVFTPHLAGQFIWEQDCELVAASVPSSPRVNVTAEWITTGLSTIVFLMCRVCAVLGPRYCSHTHHLACFVFQCRG